MPRNPGDAIIHVLAKKLEDMDIKTIYLKI
jgi:hypothetical protein